MDKSLEEIIKERNAEKKSKFQAKAKTANVNREARKTYSEPLKSVQKAHFVERKQPPQQQQHHQSQYSATAAVPSNILNRLGSKSQTTSIGTPVSISNLNQEVTLTDLTELCGSVGEVLSASFLPSVGGKSKKSANVAFARRSDAVSFVNKFHNLTLDGTQMSIKLADGAPAAAETTVFTVGGGQKNSKASMFGTALRHSSSAPAYHHHQEDEAEEEYDESPQPRFTVTMKKEPVFHNKPANGAQKSGGFRNQGGGGGSASGGGRGGGRGGGGKFNRDKNQNVSADDLDNALDSYLTNRSSAVKDD